MATLKEARLNAELSQEGVARATGLSIRTYRRIVTGRVTDPAHSTVLSICGALSVEPGEVQEFALVGEKGSVV